METVLISTTPRPRSQTGEVEKSSPRNPTTILSRKGLLSSRFSTAKPWRDWSRNPPGRGTGGGGLVSHSFFPGGMANRRNEISFGISVADMGEVGVAWPRKQIGAGCRGVEGGRSSLGVWDLTLFFQGCPSPLGPPAKPKTVTLTSKQSGFLYRNRTGRWLKDLHACPEDPERFSSG